MSIGQIVQVIGAVVDVEFPRDAMPKVYDAMAMSYFFPVNIDDFVISNCCNFRLIKFF